MAATIAKCFGEDSTRTKDAHRLGSKSATAQANTWQTFTECHVNADGSGYVSVIREGLVLCLYKFGPESAPLPTKYVHTEESDTLLP